MSREMKTRLLVVATLALIQPVIMLAESFGAVVTEAQAGGIQGVLGGVAVVVLLAFGIAPAREKLPK
jgi:hypothetical protein